MEKILTGIETYTSKRDGKLRYLCYLSTPINEGYKALCTIIVPELGDVRLGDSVREVVGYDRQGDIYIKSLEKEVESNDIN